MNAGRTGHPDGGPAAANGSCAPDQSDNGFPGTEGGAAPIAQDRSIRSIRPSAMGITMPDLPV
jgi:hypothetical protein